MTRFFKSACTVLCLFSFACVSANERGVSIVKEKQIPQGTGAAAAAQPKAQSNAKVLSKAPDLDPNYKAFTGKVVGNGVRVRIHPDVESHIVKELAKSELIVIVGEKSDFYAIEAPSQVKAYIFRSFILDNIVEGNRVNVRLLPELNAPVIAFMSGGERVVGSISEKNHKWLEIDVPKNVRFYVAKEYIEKVGGPEVKAIRDKKRDTVVQLMDSAELLSQSEMMKSFEEIDFEKISGNYNTILSDYSDFIEYTDKAKGKLAQLQESYLQKKLAYLESKASRMSKEMAARGENIALIDHVETIVNPKDRMKIWERAEEAHFLSWAANHHKKTMDDFYEDQKGQSIRVSGILEGYSDIVKNKPGNFILRDRDMPKAYLYSTFIDLQNHVGKYVTLIVTNRPNNNFAFPAYFVLDVEK